MGVAPFKLQHLTFLFGFKVKGGSLTLIIWEFLKLHGWGVS